MTVAEKKCGSSGQNVLPLVEVCAAVIRRNGQVLLCTRPPGKFMEGGWEFPGGKKHGNESDAECLVREIREEISADIAVADEIFSCEHDYPDRKIKLKFYRAFIKDCSPAPAAAEGQEISWFDVSSTPKDILPADLLFAKFLSAGAR